MMMPTAMSITLPLTAKALNSLITPIGYFLVTDEVDESSVNQPIASCSKQLVTAAVCNRPAAGQKVCQAITSGSNPAVGSQGA
jgi:hypothetical protein